MCPWPRFQAAMVDEHTLTVTYRAWRGEPRGKHKQGESWDGRGDCIDCRACVAVCPTGIDIRDGLQLECIGCGLCIDSCNDIMRKVGRPEGLIAFDTLASLAARERGETPKLNLLRPRTLVYAGVMALAVILMLGSFAMRRDLDLSVLPERSPLYVTLKDGSIRNGYTLKVTNRLAREETYRVTASGLPEATLAVAGAEREEAAGADGLVLTVAPDSVGSFRAYVRVPRDAVRGEAPLTLTLESSDGDTIRYTTNFQAPGGERR